MSEYTLNKKIAVDDDLYAVTAVHSDAAEKVDNKLTVSVNGQEGTDSIDFDGSEPISFSVVSAEGGTYNGPVKILGPGNNPTDVPTIETVQDMVSDLLGLPLHTWNGTDLSAVDSMGPTITPIKVVLGTHEDFDSFQDKAHLEGSPFFYLYLAFAKGHNDNRYKLPSLYLIHGSEVYPITSKYLVPMNDSEYPNGTSDPSFYDYSVINDAFNRIKNNLTTIETSISDIKNNTSTSDGSLPGLFQLSNLINNNNRLNQLAHQVFSDRLDIAAANIDDILTGDQTAAKATTADSATKATKDGNERTISTGYYQSDDTTNINKIYISTHDPNNIPTGAAYNTIRAKATNAKNGDIWIVYNNA